MRRLAGLAFVAALAGCGGAAHETAPRQPQLPRALARTWARQTDAVAAALAAGDDCGARSAALSLQQAVITAINDRRVPAAFLEPLGSAVNELADRIACNPAPPSAPAPAPAPAGGPDKGKGHPDHGAGHGHGKEHGNDQRDEGKR